MREFLRGWRRKLGCIALLMACVAVVGWMRGRVAIEGAVFDTGDRRSQVILIFNNHLHLYQWRRGPNEGASNYWIECSPTITEDVQQELNYFNARPGARGFSIPLIPFALSLTLLSGYLILWKPRPSAPNIHQLEKPHA